MEGLKSISGLLVVAGIFFQSCMPQSSSSTETAELVINFTDSAQAIINKAFIKRGVEGCFILYDLKKDTSLIYNPGRSEKLFLPASTFKIANSIIALECKAVKDVNEIIPWDGQERIIPAWNQDQTMRTAFKYSAVWFYQELARRIGGNEMSKWVKKLHYGNETIGPDIDDFWLVGDLRISPQQQVDFLKRLIEEDLPAKKKNIAIVTDIMVEESNDRYILRGKTGWADFGTPVGWYVGWLEISGQNYIFVMNMDILEAGDQIYRKEVTKEILNEIFQIDLTI